MNIRSFLLPHAPLLEHWQAFSNQLKGTTFEVIPNIFTSSSSLSVLQMIQTYFLSVFVC